MRQVEPIKDSIKAIQHEPEYTVHRYFARRPHNVINNIIQHYAIEDNSLIFDPFGGGGTMLYEALVCDHRAVASDTSDLAAFIIEQEALMPSADLNTLTDFMDKLMQNLSDTFSGMYSFKGKEMYWLEWSSHTLCPNCTSKVFLSPFNTAGGGVYSCQNCGTNFRPSRVHADSISPMEICCMTKGSLRKGKASEQHRVSTDSESLTKYYETLCEELCTIGLEDALKPKTAIPDCNLQRESALHKKGFLYFEQFIPKASRGVITYIGNYIINSELEDVQKRQMLFVLSASLRYCSRFSTLNQAWRGERPMEWAKSNFWTPYTFIEVNPIVTFYERWQSYVNAVQTASKKFSVSPTQGNPYDVFLRQKTFSVRNASSETVSELPDNCVDLIVTDPPYGSYLHYGELSAFWTTWLSKFISDIKPIPDRVPEAVPARKKGYPGWKDFSEYEAILTNVFTECYRLLKDKHYCVVTFNNKEPEAWIAFLRSVKRAGFLLPAKGIIFQDGVAAYKKTIDSRRGGAIFGDFIYSFYKDTENIPVVNTNHTNWRDNVDQSLNILTNNCSEISNVSLYTNIYLEFLPELYNALDVNSNDDSYIFDLNFKNFESKINEYFEYKDGVWCKKMKGF
ncbi:DNA methyltransferase [Paenibacillus sp. FSL R7-0179]|uniref:DNA methyltransferase n=1 Tax=Paenibacillus sp. FSL R7-0179 TaxID=2921672 RepID=UPI0030F9599C